MMNFYCYLSFILFVCLLGGARGAVCNAGTFKNYISFGSYPWTDATCNYGYYDPGNGYDLNNGKDYCCYCPPNEYCPGDDSRNSCGEGKYSIYKYTSTYGGSTYSYNSGQYMTCYPGQYCNVYSSSGAQSKDYCYDCPLGTYRTSTMSQCQTCSSTEFAVKAGATSCLSSCPAGYAQYSYDSATCPVTSSPNNYYYYSSTWGICYACGKSCFVETVSTESGQGCSNGYSLKTQCSACDYSKVSTGSANTECTTCAYPNGAYTDVSYYFNTSAPKTLADAYYSSTYYAYDTSYFQLESTSIRRNPDGYSESQSISDDYWDLSSYLQSNYYSVAYSNYCPGWASGVGSLGNLYSESYDGQSNAGRFSGSACNKCTAGRYWSEGLCKECLSGYYSNGDGEIKCTACPDGKTNSRSFSTISKTYDKEAVKYTYTDPKLEQASCSITCYWPFRHSLSEGGTSHVACGYFCLCVPKPVLMAFLLVIGVITIYFFLLIEVEKGKRDYWLGLNLLRFATIPVVQVMCSFFYVFTYRYRVKYGRNTGFTVEICFFFSQFLFLAYEMLRVKRAFPKLYILPMPEKLFFGEYENVFKVIITSLIAIPFIIINLPVLIPQIFVLMLLYSTRLLSIHKIQNWFFNIWTGGKYHHLEEEECLDVHMFNLSMFTQGIMALIDLSVQVNNEALSGNFYYTQNVTGFFIFSTIMNSLCFVYWLYRFIYWTLYKKINPLNIPMKITKYEFTTHRYIFHRMKIKDDEGTLKLMYSHKEKRGGDDECHMQRYINMYIESQIQRYNKAVKMWTRELWRIKDILDGCMAEDVSMFGVNLQKESGSTELYVATNESTVSDVDNSVHIKVGGDDDVVTVSEYLSKIFDELKDGDEAQEQSLVNEHFIAKILKHNADMKRISAAMAVIRVIHRKRQVYLLSKMTLYQRISTLNGYLIHREHEH